MHSSALGSNQGAMMLSDLSEMEEYKMLQIIRDAIPAIQQDGSDLLVLNKYLLKIVSRAKLLTWRSYDAEAELSDICAHHEIARLKPEVRNKLKAFLIAVHTLILEQNSSSEVQGLKQQDTSHLMALFRDNEDFRYITFEDEWRNLLCFRNYLVLSLLVVKEKNKVLLEMAAGMLSGFNLCMSGGKPSRQVRLGSLCRSAGAA